MSERVSARVVCVSVSVSVCVCVCVRVCVCVPPWTKGLTPPLFPFHTGRGVWPSCPTTRNEAVDKKGKQGLIIPVYLLQLLNTLSNLLV